MQKAISPIELRLLALVTTERSGREVAQLYEEETGAAISYGTLYTTLRRLRKKGLVRMREDRDLDGRIRFFRTTQDGILALERARHHYADLSQFVLSACTSSTMDSP